MGIAWARMRPINFLDFRCTQPGQRDFSAKKLSTPPLGDDLTVQGKPTTSLPSARRLIRLHAIRGGQLPRLPAPPACSPHDIDG